MKHKKSLIVSLLILLFFAYYYYPGFTQERNLEQGNTTTKNASYLTCTETLNKNNTVTDNRENLSIQDNGTSSTKISNDSTKCPSIKTTERQNESGTYIIFTVIEKGKPAVNYSLQGITGSYRCFPEGLLLYSYYPSDPLGPASVLFLDYNLSKKWGMNFEGLTKPVLYRNGTLFLVKHGSDQWCAEGCLYILNIETGETLTKFCRACADILDVKVVGNRTYLTTSDGYIYLLKGNETRRAFVAFMGGDVPGKSMRIFLRSDHIAVFYVFSGASGEKEYGLCKFTYELEKISCNN